MTRLLTPVDWDMIEMFFRSGANIERVALGIGMDKMTFRRQLIDRYGEHYQLAVKSLNTFGELMIESSQYQKAVDGNIQMLMYLGRVRCGQNERPEQDPENDQSLEYEHEIIRLKHENSEKLAEIKNLLDRMQNHDYQ